VTLVLYDPKPCYQLNGSPLDSVSCTCAAGVVSTDRNTLGATILTWEAIRRETHDTSGGTTVQQVDDAIARLIGVDDLSTGWWNWSHVDDLIATEGKGFLVAMRYTEVHRYGLAQIKAGVPQDELVTGQERGFTGPTSWHAQTWHEWMQVGATRTYRGKELRAPADERGLVVLDPLCDGRRPTVANGAVVYPESLVKAIVADSLMANGKLYGALTLDARYEDQTPPDPHHPIKPTLKYGAAHVHKHLKTAKPAFLRSSPFRSKQDPKSNRVRWVPRHFRFEAFQRTDHGTAINGNRVWFGNRAGDLWISDSRLEAHR
jgi:hypothetical protein